VSKTLVFNPDIFTFSVWVKDLLTEAHQKISEVGLLSTDKNFSGYLKVREDDDKDTLSSNIEKKIQEHPD